MKEFKESIFTNERSLFEESDVTIKDCVFDTGESPLKECSNLDIFSTDFKWKYPLWYCRNVKVFGGTLFEGARAGVWYTKDILFNGTRIEAPKTFRRSEGIILEDVSIQNAAETLWKCCDIKLNKVSVNGDYFAMNSSDIDADGLTLDGNYAFDGAKNATIRNSRLITKDAFWNSENVTVYDSYISGEYLGWNSKDLTLVNCTIESLQGMCYIENLRLVNCRLPDTTLAFEYSTVDADISGGIKSVFNPTSGTIKADFIEELIIQNDKVDPSLTHVICGDVRSTPEVPDWKEIL